MEKRYRQYYIVVSVVFVYTGIREEKINMTAIFGIVTPVQEKRV